MVIREREGKRGPIQPRNGFEGVESAAENGDLYKDGVCLSQG